MKRRSLVRAFASFLMVTLFTGLVMAQKPRVSPPGTASAKIGGQEITITYHRPYVKGREVLGNLIPLGKVWRLGANEATKLTTPVDIEINGLKIPAGSYSMFMLVTEDDGAKLIINKVAEQWGAFKYDESQDLGRVSISGDQGHPFVEQFTIELKSTSDKTGELSFAWGEGKATATVKAP